MIYDLIACLHKMNYKIIILLDSKTSVTFPTASCLSESSKEWLSLLLNALMLLLLVYVRYINMNDCEYYLRNMYQGDAVWDILYCSLLAFWNDVIIWGSLALKLLLYSIFTGLMTINTAQVLMSSTFKILKLHSLESMIHDSVKTSDVPWIFILYIISPL